MLKLSCWRRGADVRCGKQAAVRSVWLLAALVAGASWASANPQERIEVGLLQCSVFEPREAESGEAGVAAQTRPVSCAFSLSGGAKETYVGKVQVANPSLEWKRTLLWSVRAPPESLAAPGFLKQSYAADAKTPAGQIPDLIGEVNSGIVLQTMSDTKEGSSGAGDKSPAPFTVLGVQLELKTTAG